MQLSTLDALRSPEGEAALLEAAALAPDEDNDVWESRRRTIEIIDSLRAFSAASFVADESLPIPNAAVVIEGEP